MHLHNSQAAKSGLTSFLAPVLMLLLWAALSLPADAQRGKPLVLDFPLELYGEDLQHTPCDTFGLCVFHSSSKNDSCLFELFHYDCNLEQTGHTRLLFAPETYLEAACYGDGELVILFQYKEKKKKTGSGFFLIYDCSKKQVDTLSVDGLAAGSVSRMSHNKDLTLFSATRSNNKHKDLYYLGKGATHAQRLNIPDVVDYQIEDFGIDTSQRHVLAALRSTVNNQTMIWLCETDYRQNILFTSDLPDTLGHRCESLRMLPLDSSQWFLAGIYESRANNVTMGVYTLPYHDMQFDSLSLHPYTTASIVTPNNGQYFHTGGKLTCDTNGIVFITETLYPEYHDRPVYNYGVMTYEQTFNGYRYTSADVFVFQPDGTETWYYNFPYDNILSQQLGSYLNFSFLQDRYLLYYVRGNELVTMLTNSNDEIIDSKRTSSLFPASANSPFTYNGTQMKQWYGGYYLLSGQRRSSRSSLGSSKYFIHKLWYR
ncbi:MAG: hypothetical protein J6T59_02245 [Bacteroidales bacterium]|nr:hypothetical protein [Bacteroidales bacterium]